MSCLFEAVPQALDEATPKGVSVCKPSRVEAVWKHVEDQPV